MPSALELERVRAGAYSATKRVLKLPHLPLLKDGGILCHLAVNPKQDQFGNIPQTHDGLPIISVQHVKVSRVQFVDRVEQYLKQKILVVPDGMAGPG